MSISPFQLVVILVIILVLFGAGRLPQVMSDLGRGIKAFKSSLNEEEQGNKKNNSRKKNLKK